MNYRPILFSAPMVRALLAGNKTMTRRVVKPKHGGNLEIHDDIGGVPCLSERCGTRCRGLKPAYEVGDILWVRETWTCDADSYYYRADIDSDYLGACETLSGGYPQECKSYTDCNGCTRGEQRIIWHPSIHMPKAAARIFLRVTDVRVERLQDITEEDVCAEGAWRLITCQNQHGIIESDGTMGDVCWNSPRACAWCTEFDPCEEKYGQIVWNSTIKKKRPTDVWLGSEPVGLGLHLRARGQAGKVVAMCVNVLYQIYYGDQLVYLGRTRQPIDRRLHGHFFHKPMHKKLDARAVSRVRVAKVTTQADMFLYEIYYINKLKPALNCDDKAQDELTIELPELCWLEYDPRLLPKWAKETERREQAAKERRQREIEESLKVINERRARHGRTEMTMDEYIGNTKAQEG